ncbi:MAG: (deoxy)nucleoside triphosphate pyrophosphohydrolase [Lactobacillales bacterium]|jgi:8-oxo-dGTP diphosphatase|nr:(deoxy)nucleoside triphosphate pyrophosphohydrolase [Lactobacillales bacterium]
MAKKLIKVVGAIIIKDDEILCAQRGYEKSLPGLWEFPGGKIEQNETPREALKRELVEELHIDVQPDEQPFETTTYEYDFGIIELTTFICEITDNQQPILTEHIAIKWLKPSELNELDWAPADLPAVEKLGGLQ